MKKFLKLLPVSLFIFLLSPLFVSQNTQAAEMMIDESNPTVDEYVDENLYITGNKVVINENVNGDVVGSGSTIEINEDIYGNLIVSGMNIKVDADVRGSIFCTGAQIEILGDVSEDITAAGGRITIQGDVEEDVRVVGGEINIKSDQIGGDLFAGAGRGSIDSETEVDGTKRVDFGDEETFSMQYIADQFTFTGERLAKIGLKLARKALILVGWLIVGFFMFKFAPVKSKAITDILSKRSTTIRSLLYGFVSIFGFLLAIPFLVVLTIFGIGQPATMLIFMLLGLALTVSGIYTSTAIVRFIIKKKKPDYEGYIVPMIIGVTVYQFIGWLPWYLCCMGPIVRIVVTLWGLGGMIIYKWNLLKAK